ncbi:hypothetical protein ES288_A08G095100v1 [Gossypium darwinii]|uniref:Uncharacterized protein n=2 Tax=Gossypium TaxID=3633 RepID=A0A5D2PGS0_GOSTO|nr:hypothetical protein ES288_A08G095100v1 [Gossypium darwinii]TYI13980.1 hypothetical protein ES332_A08G096100v1 [Gossypium tomentosum]
MYLTSNTYQIARVQDALLTACKLANVFPSVSAYVLLLLHKLKFSISYCFLLLLQLLVQLKLPFNLRINIWYYRAPELIFGATKYITTIDIYSSLCLLVRLE